MSRTVEQIYKKKTPHEHVLTRPDMYIGSIESITDDIWVYDEAECRMKVRKATWTPGLYKIFDEILVNAADNKVRDPTGQTMVKVTITPTTVSVMNNGEGIPVQKHKEHDLWVPELIFGHLLTSSNYDDTEAKVTGGRNGYGAKLTNVFSKSFKVETSHSRSRKKFEMHWTKNMLKHSDPKIVDSTGPDYTKITFTPDFARFHLEEFTEDMILLMKRRVYDLAGCTDKSLRCYLNGERIEITTFAEYVNLFPDMGEERHKASYSRVNPRWEVCVRVSNIGFQQVSFVNSICTSRGGTHVKYLLDQIINRVVDAAMKKSKTEVKPHMIRPHIFLFVNCLIENPGFDSQTKETLTTVRSKFGSSCDIPNSMIDYILRSGIVERSVEMANSKLTKEIASKLRSSDRKQIMGIPKLDDANEAGGKNSHRCTLILTEGDSAKTLCTAGLAVKDRDYFGVFPLRGKPLNVRDASLKKVMECEELQCVMKIMGLDIRQKYENVESLRYGHLMIMSDQDHDGSHIKGLIINMIHYFWPMLLRAPGFLQQFITPIVKAWRKGRKKEDKALSFFSMPDYFKWKQQIGDSISHYEIRYYKGLGTSGAKEGREYFENIDRHRLDFEQRTPQDGDRIAMAFAKDRVEERKDWITNFKTSINPNASMDYSVRKVSYSDFVDKELILFSVADCERSIPSVVDGFKPGQRKILFSSFKRNLVKSLKVMQLAGYVSEHSAYHHGEQSLVQTIVAMAQDFVGSNNIPLLKQDGQFGTRLQGGKDHAAGRYIFTQLTALARFIFHAADDYIVEYRDDDGLSVEPFFYVPVIPMVLVNGTSGIGTGFSTSIPSYNPVEVIDNLIRLIGGQEMVPMKPWYFGFTGSIEEREKGKFVSHGKYLVRPDGVVSITELPVGLWTQNYKRFLEELREREIVVQYREHNTDVTVDFELFIHPQVLQQWVAQDVVEERLQLREFIHATNIIAFDRHGQITKYLDAEAVMKEFYLVRLEYYAKRKEYILAELRRLASKLECMARFVREVVDGALVITKRRKRDLLDDLRRRKYLPFPPRSSKKVSATTVDYNDEDAEQQSRDNEDQTSRMLQIVGLTSGSDTTAALSGPSSRTAADESPEVERASRDYDYLLGMKLWSLTAEMIARLNAQLQKARDEMTEMERRTHKDLWVFDLKELRSRLVSFYADRVKEIAHIRSKKLEKKKPFDARRLRVPILSDKARKQLEKDAEKISAAAARSAAKVNEASSVATPVKAEGAAAAAAALTVVRRGAAGAGAKRTRSGQLSGKEEFDCRTGSASAAKEEASDLDATHRAHRTTSLSIGRESMGSREGSLRGNAHSTSPAGRGRGRGCRGGAATAGRGAAGAASSAKKRGRTEVADARAESSLPGDDFDLDIFGLEALCADRPAASSACHSSIASLSRPFPPPPSRLPVKMPAGGPTSASNIHLMRSPSPPPPPSSAASPALRASGRAGSRSSKSPAQRSASQTRAGGNSSMARMSPSRSRSGSSRNAHHTNKPSPRGAVARRSSSRRRASSSHSSVGGGRARSRSRSPAPSTTRAKPAAAARKSSTSARRSATTARGASKSQSKGGASGRTTARRRRRMGSSSSDSDSCASSVSDSGDSFSSFSD